MRIEKGRQTLLVGLCLLMIVGLPGGALAQDQDPTFEPTPEPSDVPPEAPLPRMTEEFTQEIDNESLITESLLISTGIFIRVADIYPGPTGSVPAFMQVFNNKLYFSAETDDNTGRELWAYDGSSPPSLVHDIRLGIGASSSPAYLTVFNDKLYFQANGGDDKGYELWVYDGSNPPYLAADIYSYSVSSFPSYLTVFNNLLFFSADGWDGKGTELWSYNGSSASRAADINPNSSSSNPAHLAVLHDQLYFQADGGDGKGKELWTFDGVNAYRFWDINPGSGSSEPTFLKVWRDQVYFSANDGAGYGYEPWSFDIDHPPSMLQDIYSVGSYGSEPKHFAVFNDTLFFQASGIDNCGYELWTYDGLSDPRLMADILPGPDSSRPAYLTEFNNKLYFAANGGDDAGTELWAYIPTVTKTFKSSGAYDGWVLESARTSNKGGSLNKTATTLRVGDDAGNRQYRSILHFNTASLPDNAVLTAVKLQVKRASYKGTNPFKTHGALYVDLRKGAFSNNNALQAADWQAAANKLLAGKIPATSTSSWHTLNLAAANFKYINKKGVTQLRLRFAKQDNGDKGADYVNFYSGNAAAANRPKLIITYYVP